MADAGDEPVGDARRGLAAARAALASTGEAPHRPRPTSSADPDGPRLTSSESAAEGRVTDLEAENQRLRAALARISDTARAALHDP